MRTRSQGVILRVLVSSVGICTGLGLASSSSAAASAAPSLSLHGHGFASEDIAPGRDSGAVPVPKLIGPVSGGPVGEPVDAMLTSYKTTYHYSEREYFLQGKATAYRTVGRLNANRRWNVRSRATARYKTRILVRAPDDPSKFNGTVVVEWLNDTSGYDFDIDFAYAGEELLRDGFAYVGVSAQQVGVESLVAQDPQRYGTLHHPGDDFSYDIFSQAAKAILQPNGPLAPLHPRRLIATGDSQSASRLMTYVNAIAPTTNLFDGFILHSPTLNGAPIDSLSSTIVPATPRVRTDLRVPVMFLMTETELLNFPNELQADTRRIRTWQMSGTSHADQTLVDYGEASAREWNPSAPSVDIDSECGAVNDGPQGFIVRAAFAALNSWIVDHKPPPHSPAVQVTTTGEIATDAYGNALGGIRTPAVDAPVETLSSTSTAASFACRLLGSRVPLPAGVLHSLYPTHADYVAKVTASANAAVSAGFLLQADAVEIEQAAQLSSVPG